MSTGIYIALQDYAFWPEALALVGFPHREAGASKLIPASTSERYFSVRFAKSLLLPHF
jgi:hypothetical protein